MASERLTQDQLQYGLIESVPIAVIVATGPGLQIEYANRAALGLLNQQSDQIVGKALGELVPKVFSATEIESISDKCLANGESLQIKGKQIELPHYGAEPVRWLVANFEPRIDHSKKIIGVVCCLRDVTPNSTSWTTPDSRYEFLNNYFKVAPIGIVCYRGPRFIVDVANDQALAMWGKRKEEVVGRSVEDIFPQVKSDPVIWKRHMESVSRMERGERHIVNEVELTFYRDGVPHTGWYSYIHEPYSDSAGTVIGMMAIATDVTEQVVARKKLQLLTDSLEQQVQSRTKELSKINDLLAETQKVAKLGSWEWDIKTGHVMWSDEMFNIYGYEKKFAVDFDRATERMDPEQSRISKQRTEMHVKEALANFSKNGARSFTIPPIEFNITLPGGNIKCLRNSGKIYLTSEGTLEKIIGAVQDVTEIRATEQQLKAAIETLEERNKDLAAFSYIASHDLKEPLRKILTFSDRHRDNEGGRTNDLSRINDAAARMMNLIESVLTLSQMSNDSMELVEVDLNAVLANCMSDLEVRIRETGAVITSHNLGTIKASASQMNQLFSNLIGNSLKFCDKVPNVKVSLDQINDGGSIHPSLHRGKPYWCLTFSDNGIGFDSKYKDQLFEPFKRLHGKGSYAGTGIGLSIVKKIVERHKGAIAVESSPGQGSKFTFYLPV